MEQPGRSEADPGRGPADEARRSFRDLLDNDEYRTLAEHLPDGIVRLDPTGRIEYLNRSIAQVYGGDRLRFIGRHIDEIEEIPSSFAEPYLAAAAEVVRTGREVDLDLPSLDGRRPLLVRLAPELAPDGSVAHVLSLARDVTELRQVGDQVRLLAENVPDLIFRVDLLPVPRFTYLSPAVTALTGYHAEELLDDPAALRTLLHPDEWAALDEAAAASIAPSRVERWVRRDGREIQVEHRDRFLTDGEGRVVAVEGVIRDVTEQVAFMAALAHEARHDPVTDLANRRAVEQRIDLELLAAVRAGGPTELVVVVVTWCASARSTSCSATRWGTGCCRWWPIACAPSVRPSSRSAASPAMPTPSSPVPPRRAPLTTWSSACEPLSDRRAPSTVGCTTSTSRSGSDRSWSRRRRPTRRAPVPPGRRCCATPSWRFGRPGPTDPVGRCASLRRSSDRWPTGSSSSTTCAGPSTPVTSWCSASPRSTSRPARWSGGRRWPAGSTSSAAGSRPGSSCRSPSGSGSWATWGACCSARSSTGSGRSAPNRGSPAGGCRPTCRRSSWPSPTSSSGSHDGARRSGPIQDGSCSSSPRRRSWLTATTSRCSITCATRASP